MFAAGGSRGENKSPRQVLRAHPLGRRQTRNRRGGYGRGSRTPLPRWCGSRRNTIMRLAKLALTRVPLRRCASLFRRKQWNRTRREELQYHLDKKGSSNSSRPRHGPRRARLAALLLMDGLQLQRKEACRDNAPTQIRLGTIRSQGSSATPSACSPNRPVFPLPSRCGTLALAMARNFRGFFGIPERGSSCAHAGRYRRPDRFTHCCARRQLRAPIAYPNYLRPARALLALRGTSRVTPHHCGDWDYAATSRTRMDEMCTRLLFRPSAHQPIWPLLSKLRRSAAELAALLRPVVAYGRINSGRPRRRGPHRARQQAPIHILACAFPNFMAHPLPFPCFFLPLVSQEQIEGPGYLTHAATARSSR
jgi:hypothetical protein